MYDTFHDADGDHRVLNKKETMLAQQKQELIRAAFKEWIFKDMRRRETLVARYAGSPAARRQAEPQQPVAKRRGRHAMVDGI